MKFQFYSIFIYFFSNTRNRSNNHEFLSHFFLYKISSLSSLLYYTFHHFYYTLSTLRFESIVVHKIAATATNRSFANFNISFITLKFHPSFFLFFSFYYFILPLSPLVSFESKRFNAIRKIRVCWRKLVFRRDTNVIAWVRFTRLSSSTMGSCQYGATRKSEGRYGRPAFSLSI